MPPNDRNHLIHLFLKQSAKAEDYTSPNSFPRPKFPDRNRFGHANYLLSQIHEVAHQIQEKLGGLSDVSSIYNGIYLVFEGKAEFDLQLKSLDLPSQGIELLSVKTVKEGASDKTLAAVFVPNEKISLFIRKIEEYRDTDTPQGKPKNAALVKSIENIRLAVLQSLWTDLDEMFPSENENIWWEVWLRAIPDAIPMFNNFAHARDIRVSSRQLIFPDRHVVLAYTTAKKLAESIDSLEFIAELRRAKETTSDFLDMPGSEQSQWCDVLLKLLNPLTPGTGPVVCLLDTGVDRIHPLITQFLPENKLLTCDSRWNTNDHHGHGTEMSGLILYGDLSHALLSTQKIDISCEIESVKILPPGSANDPDLYGNITEEAVSRATITDPFRNRIVCLAITSTDCRDKGQPSSWSAAVDKICVGQTIEGKRHLSIISAGNTDTNSHIDYPSSNITDQIHDPGQSWNALTVGAYTDKATITEPQFSHWIPLAPVGDIAPGTTTSVTWENKWPIKPDVVFEGGNAAVDSDHTQVQYPPSLLLLTTDRPNLGRMFTWSADTSAASAQAAHMAAVLSTKYPDYWPETLRALIVHSADWTPQMRSAYPISNKNERERLLRICGYGVPNLSQALWSASNHLTLIVQDELKPFEGNKMKQMNIHNIPWPTEQLRDLGETEVMMKVTLSYFIEPNPARRGWQHKFRYQSHGLRFDVKTSTESSDQFVTRLNRQRWNDELGRDSVSSSSDSSDWFFGQRIRSKGSIHCDTWKGTAVSLAERSQVAVYPVVGWWREKHSEGHTNKRARYSLIVTISTPSMKVDIYTPVESKILTEIETS